MPRGGGFEFVSFTSPGDASEHKRRVRSLAAKNAPARQRRVVEYQDGRLKSKTKASKTEERSNAALAPPRVTSLLSAAKDDPFASFSRRLASQEWFLLNHCKLRTNKDMPDKEYNAVPFFFLPRPTDQMVVSPPSQKSSPSWHSSLHPASPSTRSPPPASTCTRMPWSPTG
jgi:hypothetical protein